MDTIGTGQLVLIGRAYLMGIIEIVSLGTHLKSISCGYH